MRRPARRHARFARGPCPRARQRRTLARRIEAALGRRAQHVGDAIERPLRKGADVDARERHAQGLALQALAFALRADGTAQVARDALLHQRAVRRRERVQHIAARAGERALVARLLAAAQRGAGLGRRIARIHRHGWLLVGVEDPVAILLRELAPRTVDVDTERDEDVAQVLSVPCGRPRRDRALADGQAVVRHQRSLGHLDHAPEAVAARACALRRVGREVLRVQHRLVARIRARARIEHAHEARERGDAADRGPRARRSALLLQRDRGRQAFDGIDLRHAGLIDQAPRIRRHRLEIAPLRFGVEGAERERRLARSRDAAECDERVARDVDVDLLQVVGARAANANEAADVSGRRSRIQRWRAFCGG